MGVPALFRWLSQKYPKIISPVIEDEEVEGRPFDYNSPNPNGELDNLYLDMNGIVHPCSHPEHKPAPTTEAEMMLDVFQYTNRVVNMARPRKVLMIAVDGVAPRAKMNQQRSRRFRSAQDARIEHEERERELAMKRAMGEDIDMAVQGKRSWDSNAITPGTPFMDILAASLRYWVAYKLYADPGWRNLQVIISDATVPGEGEHKIMSFIRSQRTDLEHDPNTSHCIYGLDADLIFLSLATHEPHFRVLREDVFGQDNKMLKLEDKLNMTAEELERIRKADEKKPFLWLHSNILREYLEVELNVPRMPFRFDLERAIDDWVFMCFFVGNDFLPHLPSLDVRDNGIDLLVGIWKRVIPHLKGYLTCDGSLNLGSVEKLLQSLASQEDGIFRRRKENEARRLENNKRRKLERQNNNNSQNNNNNSYNNSLPLYTTSNESVGPSMSNAEMARNYVKSETNQTDQPTDSNPATPSSNMAMAQALREKVNSEPSPDDDDPIGFGTPGYRSRYYCQKFHVSEDEIPELRKNVIQHYIEGVSWVLLYYYQGCPSWTWYYPYHYAPFASDFFGLEDLDVRFKIGKPFQPYEQLMSVLPAASGHTLPEVFRPLMREPDSPIIDFYPESFPIDMNGKRMAWQGISILPFIDETRLLEAVRGKYHLLTDAEKSRNMHKSELLLMSNQNKLFPKFSNLQDQEAITFHAGVTGLAGTVSQSSEYHPDTTLPFPLESGDMGDVPTSSFLISTYQMPPKAHGKSMLMAGYISHLASLNQTDRDNVVYGRNNRWFNKRFNPAENVDFPKHTGPSGSSIYHPRYGGYKGFLQALEQRLTNPVSVPRDIQRDFQPSHMGNRNGYRGRGDNRGRGGLRGRGRGRPAPARSGYIG